MPILSKITSRISEKHHTSGGDISLPAVSSPCLPSRPGPERVNRRPQMTY
jgi:hypothetical protein